MYTGPTHVRYLRADGVTAVRAFCDMELDPHSVQGVNLARGRLARQISTTNGAPASRAVRACVSSFADCSNVFYIVSLPSFVQCVNGLYLTQCHDLLAVPMLCV